MSQMEVSEMRAMYTVGNVGAKRKIAVVDWPQ